MQIKKQFVGVLGLLMVALCLTLAACGDATATPSAAATPTAAATTSDAATTPAATTAAATTSAATTAATTGATTTGGATSTPAATSAAGKTGVAQVVAPDKIVNRFYTDLKSGDATKMDAAMLSQDLRSSLKGAKGDKSKGLTALDTLIGLNTNQKIDSFTLDKPAISGDSATINATVKLTDGTSLKDTVSLVKNQVTNKQGTERTLWQVDKVSVVN